MKISKMLHIFAIPYLNLLYKKVQYIFAIIDFLLCPQSSYWKNRKIKEERIACFQSKIVMKSNRVSLTLNQTRPQLLSNIPKPCK